MIKSVTAKIDGNLITFVSSNGVDWYVSSVAPDIEGIYPISLTVTADTGASYTYSADDEEFAKYLKLYVTNYKSNLIKYVPPVLRKNEEFKAIFATEDIAVDLLYPSIESLFAESIIMYCSEQRITEWEKALGIIPTGTLEERRYYLKAFMRGTGKLNEAKIKSIVEAFTGGDAIVSFENSTVIVRVLPPNNGEVYRFPDVERALKPLIPAHLGLSVIRFYSTWGDIKSNYVSWEAVARADSWGSIKNYIAP